MIPFSAILIPIILSQNMSTSSIQSTPTSNPNPNQNMPLTAPTRTIASKIYYYNKGFRFAYPYHHVYTTHTKGRWIGRTLPEIFAKEFTYYTEDYIEKLLECGAIKVNRTRAYANQRLKNGDLIEHKTHRHELPVKDDPIDFLRWEEDHFVVDKPASVPVHPCGHYRRASLTHILEHEYGVSLESMFPVHRLDRLTSGVLIIARTQAKASELASQMQNQKLVKKCYLAKVKGRFPGVGGSDDSMESDQIPVTRVDANLDLVDKTLRSKWHIVPRGEGKPCRTLFTPVYYDAKADESIVMCSPITGRTHQIRVHLYSLGHSITNDPCYGPVERVQEFDDRFEYFLSDEQRAILDQKKEEYRQMLERMQKETQESSDVQHPVKRQRTNNGDKKIPKVPPTRLPQRPTAAYVLTTYPDETLKVTHKDWQFDTTDHVDPNCFDCTLTIFPRSESDYMIYLHSFGYEVHNMRVFTKLPDWASHVSQEAVEQAWERLKNWEDDHPSYNSDIEEAARKKTWGKKK